MKREFNLRRLEIHLNLRGRGEELVGWGGGGEMEW